MSTSTIFKFPSVIRRQHEGPLGIHIDMYEALLGEHGYSRSSTYVHLHIVGDLSRWLKRQGSMLTMSMSALWRVIFSPVDAL